MRHANITTRRALTLILLGCATAGACAGDDKKNVPDGEAGAGGESGGEQAHGGSSSLPSEGGAPGLPGDAIGGEPGNGTGGTVGGSDGNGGGPVDGVGEAGAPANGDAGSSSNGGAPSSGGAPGAAGASGDPVPSGCISCGNEFCLAAYFDCSEFETCTSCRDVSFSAPECADDFFFNEYRDCLCQYCGAGACSALCGG